MLAKFAEQYHRDLVERVVPFWLNNSLDRECGGYFSCLDFNSFLPRHPPHFLSDVHSNAESELI